MQVDNGLIAYYNLYDESELLLEHERPTHFLSKISEIQNEI